MDTHLNRCFTKEDAWTKNIHVKGHSISLVIREMQTKAIVRYVWIPTRSGWD